MVDESRIRRLSHTRIIAMLLLIASQVLNEESLVTAGHEMESRSPFAAVIGQRHNLDDGYFC